MKKITKLMLLMLIGLMLVGCGNKQEKFIKDAIHGHEWGEQDNQGNEDNRKRFLGKKVVSSYFFAPNNMYYCFMDEEAYTVDDSEKLYKKSNTMFDELNQKISRTFGECVIGGDDDMHLIGEDSKLRTANWRYNSYKIFLTQDNWSDGEGYFSYRVTFSVMKEF